MKYLIDEDRIPKELFIQYCIANELAEANRLKRLEFMKAFDDTYIDVKDEA